MVNPVVSYGHMMEKPGERVWDITGM